MATPPDLMDPESMPPEPTSPPPVAPDAPAFENDHIPSSSSVQPNYEHSLPSAEEARTESVISHGTGSGFASLFCNNNNKYSGRKKQLIALVAIGCCALALIIGVSMAFSGGNRNSESSESSSESSNSPTNNSIEPEDPSLFNVRDTSRLSEVREFLGHRISSPEALRTEGTPQYEAALWIADKDAANMPIPGDPNMYDSSYPFVQRYIMAVFYFALNGAAWKKKMYFLSERSVCDWHKNLFKDSAPVAGAADANWKLGVSCDADDAITHIFITDNGLEGELPTELGDLLDLYHLSLYKNWISGGFPQRMKNLVDMRFLAMESNQLDGSLPTWLNSLTNLKYLALGSNKLTGPIPNLVGMVNLRDVALDDNQLTGNIHNFKEATALERLYLNRNDFDGRIHDSTLDNLENLKVLDLGNNYFTGYFPDHFYQLEQVDVHMNTLSEWPLPRVVITDSPLEFLSVHSSGIKGVIPADFGLLKELRYLDLSNNDLTGAVPDVFGSMIHLQSLYLSNNNFQTGEIPYLEPCTGLRELAMASTKRSGRLHSYFGMYLKELELIDLHNNTLTGSISSHMGELGHLTSLFLNHNRLYDAIPAELGNLPQVVSIFVDHNDLTGTANPVCDADPEELTYFVSDCKVTCKCCTLCCADGDVDCNDSNMVGRSSTKTIKMLRDEYLFSEDLTFRENTKNLEEVTP